MAITKFPDLPEGYSFREFDVLDSTNAECRRIADSGAKGNIWVRADRQTAGRGRRGREWLSGSGNLFASLLYSVDCGLLAVAGLSLVAALAVRDVVADILQTNSRVKCKWPNDILVGDKKIAGILLETAGQGGDHPRHVIIGIGINISHHPEGVPYPATNLTEELGRDDVVVAQVMAGLVLSMARWIAIWQESGFQPIRKAWKDNACGLGQEIIVRLPNEELQGRFVDLDETGALILEFGGKRRHITAGDVFFT